MTFVLAAWLVAAAPVSGQIAAPNAAGVAMGHLHYFVEDVAAHRDFWIGLGGKAVESGLGPIVEMPGVLILISEREAETRAGPSVLDHVAFRVESLAAIEARGYTLQRLAAFPGIASVETPSGDRVELFEEGTATNVGFAPDIPDETAERHNRPLAGALDAHHLHFYLPEAEVETARHWYVAHFGAVPGLRWRYPAADLPGMNLNFSAADPAPGGTRGRSLDHIGFEIENLEAFCIALAAEGLVFDTPYQRVGASFAFAVLTDPWGTRLELTEGLRRF